MGMSNDNELEGVGVLASCDGRATPLYIHPFQVVGGQKHLTTCRFECAFLQDLFATRIALLTLHRHKNQTGLAPGGFVFLVRLFNQAKQAG